MRKRPKQERSSRTIKIIYQAVERVLDKFGLEGFNTNKLAETSGFSTGTIYQYFSNKDSIINSMIVHYHDATVERLVSYLKSADPCLVSADALINEFIARLLSEYLPEEKWRRILAPIGWAMDQDPRLVDGRIALAEGIFDVVDRYIDANEYRMKRVSREEVLVLVTSIAGCIRGVVFNGFIYDRDKLITTMQKIIFAILINPTPSAEQINQDIEL
ncbi:TetR/AcrR family transcriptional regulator [uncultured Aquitalea sp.]|uniref:TetR/AcrR family transcriptional regulator n=2 Tax=uncultured Aquitalea sp. TaxID=540272 RepID=UPI0025CBEEAE|nr:TetR/AcrR family transcriptional regulator [uncultured Aquitalea sp.]